MGRAVKPKPHTCGTCKFATFSKTPTGLTKHEYSKCQWKPSKPLPDVPVAFEITLSSRFSIWPEMGQDCPTYKDPSHD